MRAVHLIVGHTGEYEDRSQWTVAAFSTKARAETFERKANDWLKARGLHAQSEHVSARSRAFVADTSPYDPKLRVDYTGTRYGRVQVFLNPPLPTKSQGA